MIVRLAALTSLTALAALMECSPARRMEAAAASAPTPFAVMAEFDRLGALDLWPGWDPRRTPVMIFDGHQTFLFRHPAPPAPFRPLAGHPDVMVMDGRNENLTANSSAKIAGTQTATVLLPSALRSATSTASLVIHEAFHVYERERHPGWTGNEAELFTFPVTDTTIVTWQRLEAEALRRALGEATIEQSACWATTAMRIRQQRFAAMSSGAVGYERGTELNEGLANYVEKRSIALPDSSVFTLAAFPPEAVRQRAYATGLAIARLLDRVSPAWRATLDKADTTSLDAMLSAALSAQGSAAPSSSCDFDETERDAALTAASQDVDSLRANREHARMSFLAQRGWTLIVSAPTSPLFPQGFDPLNVMMLTNGEVLHTRWVKLGNDRGTIEVIDQPTLTDPAGSHPLFNGIRTATVGGLKADLSVTRSTTGVVAKAKGLALDVRNARADTSGSVITVRLLP